MTLPLRCVDLTSQHVVRALASRVMMHELLGHLASIAKPATGAAKILVPIARMASTECDWIDGKLVVRIEGNEYTTSIRMEVDGGKGPKGLFPRMLLRVPLEELTKAVKLAPKLVYPLKARPSKGGLVLSCDADMMGTLPPTPFKTADAAIEKSLPPAVRHSLLPRDTEPVRMQFDMPEVGEAELLARFPPKMGKAPRLEAEDDIDAGWDVAPASAKPSSKRAPSKAPARKPSKAPARTTKTPSKAPVRTIKKPSKAPARTTKAPSKKPPPRPTVKKRSSPKFEGRA